MDEGSDQTEWNFAQLNNMELARLGTSSNDYFISGNYSKAFKAQIARKMTGSYMFNKDERDSLEELEKRIAILMEQLGGTESLNKNQVRVGRVARISLLKIYPTYVQMVSDLLDKYGFFGSRKKDASKMGIRRG